MAEFMVGALVDTACTVLESSAESPQTALENGRAAIYAAFTNPEAAAFCASMLMVDDKSLARVVFGRNMTRARALAGHMSQETLAVLLGVDRRIVNRWEGGHREPRGHQRVRIAKALGQPLEFFYDEVVLEEGES